VAVDVGKPLERGGGQIAADQDKFGADDAGQREHQEMMENGKHKIGGVHGVLLPLAVSRPALAGPVAEGSIVRQNSQRRAASGPFISVIDATS